MDRFSDLLRSPRWTVERQLSRAVLSAGMPVVATGIGLLLPQRSATAAALIYVVAVLIVAGTSGAVAGSSSALISFFGLNFFFTPPLHSLRVDDPQDVTSLIAFFLVAVVVGGLFSALVSARQHTERREAETQLATRLATRLLSGEEVDRVLLDLASGLRNLFGLEWVWIEIDDVRVRSGKITDIRSAHRFPIGMAKDQGGEIAFPTPLGLRGEDERALGNIVRQVGVALDRMRVDAEARSAQLDLETSQLRAALLSSVTHDLRTPLSSITASVTSLIDAGDDISTSARYELLDTIRSESIRLNRLLSNLLDLSRLRAGALVPSPVKTSVDEIVEGVLGRLRTQFDTREVELVIRDGLPELEVDVIQIDQLLTNLIENAMKFSPSSAPVQITLSGWEGGVRVRIADRGPGIPADEREAMFEPFAHGDGAAAGAGLGLAIARAVAVAHGGRLWLEGSPGGGTAAVLELPTPVGRDQSRKARVART